jgi:serine carboxypeptidase-like clade 1
MNSPVITMTLFCMALVMTWAVASPHEITHLPGLHDGILSRQFGGYIDVNTTDSGRRSLFYWVVHSERSFEDDPVILWLTGGPGCSSMDAFIYEHGPYTFHLDSDESVTLRENPYSWSKLATMIYVDSPAGAGLSYSESEADYHTSDTKTIDDLARFLTGLMEEMPELSNKDLYLAGESYGGVYVPKLAHKILDMNKVKGSTSHAKFNLKGYLVGNPVTDDVIEGNTQVGVI